MFVRNSGRKAGSHFSWNCLKETNDVDQQLHPQGPARLAGRTLLFTFHGTGGDEKPVPRAGRPRTCAYGRRSCPPRGDVSECGAALSSAVPARASTTWTTWRAPPARWRPLSAALRCKAKPSAVLGIGYSERREHSRSVVFARPALFDATVLMHPLIPFEPKADGDHYRPERSASRRDGASDLSAQSTCAARGAFARRRAPMHGVEWHERRTRDKRTRSPWRGFFLKPRKLIRSEMMADQKSSDRKHADRTRGQGLQGEPSISCARLRPGARRRRRSTTISERQHHHRSHRGARRVSQGRAGLPPGHAAPVERCARRRKKIIPLLPFRRGAVPPPPGMGGRPERR